MTPLLYQMRDRLTGRAPPGARRRPEWRRFRAEHIGDECEVCERDAGLELHHKVPFFLAPDLECDPRNVCTLCRDCHYTFGHLRNWEAFNPVVTTDVIAWGARIREANEA